jgi:acid phosphatase type 7
VRTRHLALVAVVFAAVLILLFGLLSYVTTLPVAVTVNGEPVDAAAGSLESSGIASPRPSPAGTGSAGPSASGGPVPSGSNAAPGASPSPGGDPVLVGAGDIANCDIAGDAATATLIEGIPGTVFAAGDNAYQDGSPANFQDCYDPTWGRFLDRTVAVPGNHDWQTKDLAGYLAYFGTHGSRDGKTWYAFDLGAWHIVMLDSECSKIGGCDAASPEGRWLAADLAASTARCTLAIWHRPRWSSGIHGDDENVEPFWQALYAAGADVVINGHEHDYERFAPQDPTGNEDRIRGIREFVVGTGGAELRSFRDPAPNSELRIAGVNGVLKLTLKVDGYDWQFIPTATDVSDAGSGPCH